MVEELVGMIAVFGGMVALYGGMVAVFGFMVAVFGDMVVAISSSHQSPCVGVFAVSVGAVHNDSTVCVVGIEGRSKRWWVS